MAEPASDQRLLDHLRSALLIADELGYTDVAISLDRALNQLDSDDQVLRDSAARIWVLPD